MKEKTIFDTPGLKHFFVLLARFILKLHGWKAVGEKPVEKKYVLIAAPHTSNWDLYFTLLVAFALEIKIYWMGKQAIFNFPFYHLMTWMGGIPVDRNKSHNMVQATIDTFKDNESLVVTVPPEGTRSSTPYWKTGFYYIAHGAEVPIALGFLDFGKKEGGLGPMFTPTGDIDKDMKEIKAYYNTITPKNPQMFNHD